MTEAAIEAKREEELSALLVTTTGTFPPTMKPAAQALPPMVFKGRGVLPSQIICCVTDEVKK